MGQRNQRIQPLEAHTGVIAPGNHKGCQSLHAGTYGKIKFIAPAAPIQRLHLRKMRPERSFLAANVDGKGRQIGKKKERLPVGIHKVKAA